jgi:UDP-N-acetylmuramate: L-alanyl-gamma-D-glutamyl-meso-diaminopimelate ligase
VKSQAVLDPALNFVPDDPHRIHIMGVCGTGMAALAGMLKERGFMVAGSDQNVYPPMSDFLKAAGIEVREGYGPENLEPGPDLVIVGNVIRAVNPEAVRLGELRIPYVSMPQALGHFFLNDHVSLVVAGTHGKTTTSSLLASVLHAAGSSPGFMIGGIVEAFQRNYNLGQGRYFVVEGDEYDTAFFDKDSKFLHYQPDYAIVTSIEYDHADIFSDLQVIKNVFGRFVRLVPAKGAIFACQDDPVVRDVCREAACQVVGYGTGADCAWRVDNFSARGLTSIFDVYCRGSLFGRFHLPMPGMHNVLNATAVIALLDHLGFQPERIRDGLASFLGVKRRQQIRGEVNSITVVDDFAHHPTAVRETTAALKAAWPERRLIVVFEPRTNSSRRSVFQEEYAEAFRSGEIIVVRQHMPLDNIPFEQQFSSARLVQDLRARGKDAHYFAGTEEILDFLADHACPGDVIAILSNGGFDNIHARLLARLSGGIVQ